MGNMGCAFVGKWEKNNLRCKDCQLANRQRRKNNEPSLRWRWVRCAAQNCKAMYIFNRGKRLARAAGKCGLLELRGEGKKLLAPKRPLGAAAAVKAEQSL